MEKLFTLNYYFSIRPNPNFNFSKITLALALALIVIGIVFEWYRRKKIQDKIAKKILKSYPGKFMWFGFIACALLLFRELGIPYLSMRIWWIVLAAVMLYSGIKLCLMYKKKYQERLEMTHKHSEVSDKYLPKKKKR